MQIRNKLLEINKKAWLNSEKLDLTETFIKEFAISFSRFLELLKINHPELYWSKNVDELIEIYQDENRG
jgi:hypothetical protein